jgi:ParB family chromosome partitioning protein
MPEVIAADADDADHGVVGAGSDSDDRHRPQIEVPRAEIDVEGQSNLCHETQTDMATRGLMRDLADNPAVALTALIAQLFKTLVLVCRMVGDSALDIKAAPYEGKRSKSIESLDGDVWARINARKEAYTASGLRPIPWIETLAFGERMALLAELVAVSLNVREDRKDAIRHAARAEAAEIAELCGYDIARHWTPDEAYLSIHSKPQLVALLGEMRRDDPRAGLFKKGELVAFVAETAAELRFAPATLAWARAADGESAESTPPESARDTQVV